MEIFGGQRSIIAYIRGIKEIFDGTKTKVSTVGGDSKHFHVMMGLHYDQLLVHIYLPW